MMKAISNGKMLSDEKIDYSEGHTVDQDGIVPVLFPSETWATVQDMAKEMGVSTTHVLSIAIERLYESLRSEDGVASW